MADSHAGRTWTEPALPGDQPDRSLEDFKFALDAKPRERSIMTRATDPAGNTQPEDVPFNEKGYLFSQPVPHPIRFS